MVASHHPPLPVCHLPSHQTHFVRKSDRLNAGNESNSFSSSSGEKPPRLWGSRRTRRTPWFDAPLDSLIFLAVNRDRCANSSANHAAKFDEPSSGVLVPSSAGSAFGVPKHWCCSN